MEGRTCGKAIEMEKRCRGVLMRIPVYEGHDGRRRQT